MNGLCIVIVGCGMPSSLEMMRLVQKTGALYASPTKGWYMPTSIEQPDHHLYGLTISDFLANQEAKEAVRRRHYLAKNMGRKPFMMRRKLGG